MDNNKIRIGLVVPPGNVAMERELALYLPDEVLMNVNRLSRPTPQVTKESLLAMIDSVDQAVKDLQMCFPCPSVIIYGCTSGSFVSGPGREAEIADRITKLVHIPAVTTSTAIIDALYSVKAKNLFLLTPYVQAVTEEEISLLKYHGLNVSFHDSFNCLDTRDIARLSTSQVESMVLQHKQEIENCDTVFISCTQLLTMDKIESLEKILGKTVITSNQSSLWAGLKMLNVAARKDSPGRLFDDIRCN
jgi:maleate isomerase